MKSHLEMSENGNPQKGNLLGLQSNGLRRRDFGHWFIERACHSI